MNVLIGILAFIGLLATIAFVVGVVTSSRQRKNEATQYGALRLLALQEALVGLPGLSRFVSGLTMSEFREFVRVLHTIIQAKAVLNRDIRTQVVVEFEMAGAPLPNIVREELFFLRFNEIETLQATLADLG